MRQEAAYPAENSRRDKNNRTGGLHVHTILIVDDQFAEAETIATLIQRHRLPLQSATARNGEEALEWLRANRADILFTDIKMPLMDGLELARRARELHEDMQIVIYSAYGEFEYAQQAIGVRAVHYLLKPLEIEEFLQVMQRTIALCERERQLRHKLEALETAGHIAPPEGATGQQSDTSEPKGDEDGNTRKVIQDVLAIIDADFGGDISIESIAAQVYLSPSYLGHLFKKQKGQSLRQYITAYRIEQAKIYLRSTNIRIVDIGKKVGFPNPSYFTLMFRSHTGVTPAQYREEAVST